MTAIVGSLSHPAAASKVPILIRRAGGAREVEGCGGSAVCVEDLQVVGEVQPAGREILRSSSKNVTFHCFGSSMKCIYTRRRGAQRSPRLVGSGFRSILYAEIGPAPLRCPDLPCRDI